MSESIRYSAPCPICGGTDFTWGNLSDASYIRFTKSGFKSFWGIGRKKIAARRCDTCGHLQLFTEIPKDSPKVHPPEVKEKRKRDE